MCKAIREGDEMSCSCGLRWGTDEDDPHPQSVRGDSQTIYNNMSKLMNELYNSTPSKSSKGKQ